MKNKRLDIYVGLGNQIHDKYDDAEAAKNKFSSYFNDEEIGFSIVEQVGGYVLENGKYIVENSLRISIIGDIDNDNIKTFANAVKDAFNQETVLINLTNIDSEYVTNG